jgi:Aldehyde dehydrogenase family
MSPLSFLISCSGPVISPASKDRILGLIGSAEEEGGKIHLDGRHIEVSGYEHGNFIGPTIIEADTRMKCYEYVAALFFLSCDYKALPQSRDLRACSYRPQGRHSRRGHPDHQPEPLWQWHGNLYSVWCDCTEI